MAFTQEKLLDTYEVFDEATKKGVTALDETALFEQINELAEHTEAYRLDGKDIKFFSISAMEKTATPATVWYLMEGIGDPLRNGYGVVYSLETLQAPGAPFEKNDESTTMYEAKYVPGAQLVMSFPVNGKEEYFTCSQKILGDMGLLKMSGLANQGRKGASYHIAGQLALLVEDEKVTVIVRRADDGVGKVVGFRSGTYGVADAADTFFHVCKAVTADGDLVRYEVNNFQTKAYYAFNLSAVDRFIGGEMVHITPMMKWSDSSTGNSAFGFELGFQIGNNPNHTVFLASGKGSAKRIHSGDIDSAKERIKLLDAAYGLRDKFMILTDRLEQLAQFSIASSEVSDYARKIYADVKLNSVLGKKRIGQLVSTVSDSFSAQNRVSLDSLVLYMMTLQEHPALNTMSRASQEIFKNCLAEIPYLKLQVPTID